jgi:hypothetical protein
VYRIIIAAVIALVHVSGAIPAMAETYTTELNGTAQFSYDANPNVKFPDLVGYGVFGVLGGNYILTTEGFPPPEAGVYNWYLDPRIDASGAALGLRGPVTTNASGYAIHLVVDENGVLLTVNGDVFGQATWAELGYLYVAGKGVYMTTMVTPDVFFPPDPDRLVGLYESDYDGDSQSDFDLMIAGSGGAHKFQLNFNRSATWMGLEGTGLSEAFADWLDTMLPGLPPDLLDPFRGIDMSPLVDLEALLGHLGGPVPGKDVLLAGTIGLTLLVECTGASTAEAATWSKVKAMYR